MKCRQYEITKTEFTAILEVSNRVVALSIQVDNEFETKPETLVNLNDPHQTFDIATEDQLFAFFELRLDSFRRLLRRFVPDEEINSRITYNRASQSPLKLEVSCWQDKPFTAIETNSNIKLYTTHDRFEMEGEYVITSYGSLPASRREVGKASAYLENLYGIIYTAKASPKSQLELGKSA